MFISRLKSVKHIIPIFVILVLVSCTVPKPMPTTAPISEQSPANPQVTVIPRESRPNIVLIIADDLDLRLGTIATMPNLQKLLVHQGLSFDNFYVTDSICCPSRSTFLRGQYVHNHTIYTNVYPTGGFQKFFEDGLEASTLGVWLQPAGYKTVLLGKYLNEYPSKSDPLHVPVGWSEWYSPIKGKPYSGFNYALNENGQEVFYGDAPEDYITDVLTRKTLDFIQRASAESQPFFVYFSSFAPHEPPKAAYRHRDLFQDARAPQTPSFNEADVSDKPSWIQGDPLLTDEEIIALNELYIERLQSMQAVDEMISQLIQVLQETGTLENTYIVFTSDNGYHLGQHRLKNGKGSAYLEDIQVPFVIRGPGVPQGDSLKGYVTGNIDFAPTIADLAGIIPPEFVDGRSLAPLFADNRPGLTDWRDGLLFEYFREEKNNSDQESRRGVELISYIPDADYGIFEPFEQLIGLPTGLIVPYRGIITAQYKYVRYEDDTVELYNIQADPFELENIAPTTDPVKLNNFSNWLDLLSACAGADCRELDRSPQ